MLFGFLVINDFYFTLRFSWPWAYLKNGIPSNFVQAKLYIYVYLLLAVWLCLQENYFNTWSVIRNWHDLFHIFLIDIYSSQIV